MKSSEKFEKGLRLVREAFEEKSKGRLARRGDRVRFVTGGETWLITDWRWDSLGNTISPGTAILANNTGLTVLHPICAHTAFFADTGEPVAGWDKDEDGNWR